MNPKKITPRVNDEFYTEERCHILEILNTEEHPNFSLAQARVEVGVTTVWHTLKEADELYYIIQGTGEMEIEDDFKSTLTKGDAVLIPKNKSQRIKNTGTVDLVFLCVCAPRWKPELYFSDE